MDQVTRRFNRNIIEVNNNGRGYDGDTFLRVSVSNAFNHLLSSYEYVLFCDADMFIVPDPEKYPRGLLQYVCEFEDTFAQCSGYNVICKDGTPLDIDKTPWLMQRTHWHRQWQHFCKVVLANKDPRWGGGFHTCRWVNNQKKKMGKFEREDLRLIHLAYVCPLLLRRRWEVRVKENKYKSLWDPNNARRAVLEAANTHQFTNELIPDKWRMAL